MNRAIDYKKTVLNKGWSKSEGCSMFRYWGAIGDFIYYLTFVRPLLEKLKGRKILAADVYPRYAGHPLLELCIETGLFNELWTNDRAGGGPEVLPTEMFRQVTLSNSSTLFRPGIYYHTYEGKGMSDYPLEYLRDCAKKSKRLIDTPSLRDLIREYPVLEGGYITLHPFTPGKSTRNQIPQEIINILQKLKLKVVVIAFDRDLQEPIYRSLNTLPNFEIVRVDSTVECLKILSNSRLHIGVESSQILGAAIHNVHSLFFPFGGGNLGQFVVDLGIKPYLHVVDWVITSKEFAKTVDKYCYSEFMSMS